MTDITPLAITIHFPYWVAFRANMKLLLHVPTRLALSAIFPLAACYVIYLMATHPYRHVSFFDCIMVIFALFFTPIMTSINLFFARRRNSFANGPFTYALTHDDIAITGTTFDFKFRWAAVKRVIETREFMFIFTAPACAQCIPLNQLSDQELDQLRHIIRSAGVQYKPSSKQPIIT